MIFKNTVPIFYSNDVSKSISYYLDILEFENSWNWGDPPNFGGVSKNSVEIFFCEKGQGHPGTWLYLVVDDVDAYHERLKAKGAKILCEPETMDWGMREMLVEDPDGHKIRFGQGGALSDKEKTASALTSTVKIVERIPNTIEMQKMGFAIGEAASAIQEITSTIHGFVAEDSASGDLIGCVFLLGDNTPFYYVRNLWVHPGWRNKRVGSALMQELTDWLEKNAPDKSYIYLHTAEALGAFYKQFGFGPAFGMFREIRRMEI